MTTQTPFGQILEAADCLSLEEQRELIDILNRRWAEAARKQIARDIEDSRKEFAAGQCKVVTPDELMREILQ